MGEYMNSFNIIRILDLISNNNIINSSSLENNIIPKSDTVWNHYHSGVFMEGTSTNRNSVYYSIVYKSPSIQPFYLSQKDALHYYQQPYSWAALRPSIAFVE